MKSLRGCGALGALKLIADFGVERGAVAAVTP